MVTGYAFSLSNVRIIMTKFRQEYAAFPRVVMSPSSGQRTECVHGVLIHDRTRETASQVRYAPTNVPSGATMNPSVGFGGAQVGAIICW